MAKAVKVGDQGTEHDGFPPTCVIAGSPTVNFDGSPAARVGDPLEPHDSQYWGRPFNCFSKKNYCGC